MSVGSFVAGFFLNPLFNKVLTPKIEISKYYGFNPEKKEYTILVKNCSKNKHGNWGNIYDLRIHLRYCKKINDRYRPVHSGEIKMGRLVAGDEVPFSIMPKKIVDYCFNSTDYRIEITLIGRNHLKKIITVDQICTVNNAPTL